MQMNKLYTRKYENGVTLKLMHYKCYFTCKDVVQRYITKICLEIVAYIMYSISD